MTPLIQQSVRFRTSPRALFDLYLGSRRHSLSTGAPATISRKVGGKFKAFDGQLEGKNLLIVPGKQIVQLWRATHWKKADRSILILTFSHAAGGAQVDLAHVGVPAYDHKGVSKGWAQYYWRPWKKYLRGAAAKRRLCPFGRFSSDIKCLAMIGLWPPRAPDFPLLRLPTRRQRTAQFPACPH